MLSFSFFDGFTLNVWVLMILELFERLAYYGCTFTLSTYTMYMLNVSMSTMNILVNLMYVLSPLSALIGGGMSDGKWGRKWVLLFGSVMYTVGLSAIASSAMPWMYEDFPEEPNMWALITLCLGIALLSVGYGSMKVCLAPLMADSALVSLGRCCIGGVGEAAPGQSSSDSTTPRSEHRCTCGCREGGVCCCNSVIVEERNKAFEHVISNARQSFSGITRESIAPLLADESLDYGSAVPAKSVNTNSKTNSSSSNDAFAKQEPADQAGRSQTEGQSTECHSEQEVLELEMRDSTSSLLSRLFRLDYFVINFGSIIGIAGAPFLRDADPRTKLISDESDGGDRKEVHVGYYIGFWVCAVSTLIGTIVYALRMARLPTNKPSRTMLILKVSLAAIKGRLLYGRCQRGTMQTDAEGPTPDQQKAIAIKFYDERLSPLSPSSMEWRGPRIIMYAEFESFLANATSEADMAGKACESDDLVSKDEAMAFSLTLALCVSFSPLPVYWLLATQFSSNVVMQTGWMDMPANLPPEIFNNVNTATILVMIPLMEYYLHKCHANQRISVVGRMTAGFMLMFASMGFCAVLQFIIASRGTFVSDSTYVLHEGQSLISALWLIIPFVLQGAAAVFVDTTNIEAAYTAAPSNMKSTVMAMYLLASAASGFLGLAFAPFIAADNMSTIMVIFCALQLLVTGLFLVISWGWGFCCCGAKGTKRKAVLEQLHTFQ